MPVIEQPGLDLWTAWGEGAVIVIPTNVGWKADGSAVMGRGLALDAANLFPLLPKHYGDVCRHYAQGGIPAACLYLSDARLLLVPSKPLNRQKPWLSWQGPSTLVQVRDSLQRIKAAVDEGGVQSLVMPLLGTGNGGLPLQVVYTLTVTELADTVGTVVLSTPIQRVVEDTLEGGTYE